MARRFAILLSGPLVALALLGARSDPGLAGWIALALFTLAVMGSFTAHHILRRTVVEAALFERTRLRLLLSGRVTGCIAALLTAALVLCPVFYVACTGSRAEATLLCTAALVLAAAFAGLDAGIARQVRAPFRAGLLRGPIVLCTALPLALVHMWIAYAVAPAPAWLAPTALGATLRGALTDLPPVAPPLDQVFTVLRAGEALAQWGIRQPGAATLPLVLLLLMQGAAIAFSCARLTADVASALAAPWKDRP